MNLSPLLKVTQRLDRKWQRWRRPDVRSVLVNSRTPVNYMCAAPIYLAMKDDRRVRFYFTSTEDPKGMPEIYREADPSIQMISPQRASLMRFDAYLASDFLWGRLPRGTCRIQMFHGVAGKYNFDVPDNSVSTWDRFFFINERRQSNYFASGVLKPGSPAARLVGMPKVDALANGALKRDEVLGSLGIDPQRQVIIYAPTWSPYSSLNAMGEDLVRQLVAAGYAVIVKLHDRSRDPRHRYSGGVNWPALIEPIVRAGGGVLATGSDSGPYLAAADLMITDHSSIGFEFMLLDRPVIRIEMPELIANAFIHPDYVTLLANASTTTRDVAETVSAAAANFSNPGEKAAARKAAADELYYQPGTATDRAVREVYEVIELEPLRQ